VRATRFGIFSCPHFKLRKTFIQRISLLVSAVKTEAVLPDEEIRTAFNIQRRPFLAT
jgi:hypothetical protein